MLEEALFRTRGPVAVRYSRGGEGEYTGCSAARGAVVLRPGRDITLLSYGMMINEVSAAAELLEQQGISAQVVKLNSVKPLDMDAITEAVAGTGRLLVAEECMAAGCIGQQIAARLMEQGVEMKSLTLCNLKEQFITHGSVDQLRRLCGIDRQSICDRAREVLRRG